MYGIHKRRKQALPEAHGNIVFFWRFAVVYVSLWLAGWKVGAADSNLGLLRALFWMVVTWRVVRLLISLLDILLTAVSGQPWCNTVLERSVINNIKSVCKAP